VFNDSKSTTVAASVAAVTTVSTAYPDRRIVIMLGGLSKAGSWQPLLSAVKGVANVDRAVCFGKDGGLIAEHLRGGEVECSVVPTLADGVALAKSFATPESVVLLSPGCASFDEFRDFEGRGAAFKQLVRELF
jgi:UDP-N-acetylmuramoylalanine--D-glutamate ligase